MKKTLVALLCMGFLGVANSRENCEYYEEDIYISHNGNRFFIPTGEKINGRVCGTLDDGTNYAYEYKNGREEGSSRVYDSDGKLRQEAIYKAGKIEGYFYIYERTGKIFAKILYKNNKPVSGFCRDGSKLTNAEIINWENGHAIRCN